MDTAQKQRWAITLSYDGSRFYGWQKQAGGV
ncbi:TPA: tRNA pseudouridine(38-40) synthase TruA, partial [Neisseria meningitidis]